MEYIFHRLFYTVFNTVNYVGKLTEKHKIEGTYRSFLNLFFFYNLALFQLLLVQFVISHIDPIIRYFLISRKEISSDSERKKIAAAEETV